MKVKKEQDGIYKYGSMVRLAKMDLKAKALLWHYAYAYNWSENKPSYYTQDQICAIVGFAPSTYQQAKKKLVELGWIKTIKLAYDSPVFVTPTMGIDDPEYEKASWAKWHKSKRTTIEEDIASLPDEYRNPFSQLSGS